MLTNNTSQDNSSSENTPPNAKQFLTIGLDVAGRPCLVVGGGSIGTHKALLLAEKGAKVTILAPEISETATKAVTERKIHWQKGKYSHETLKGVFLVIAATPHPHLNLQIGRDAETSGILSCITSAGQTSPVIFPALYQHGENMVAVHSHGQDPQASVRLRDLIARLLADEPARNTRIDSSLLQDKRSSADQGKVYIIGAGPGAPDLITIRGRKAIQIADVIIYDRILGPSFVEQLDLPSTAKTIEWLGAGTKAPQRQTEINQKMLQAVRAGKIVARIKNGDPFVFGRGAEEVNFLKDNKLPWEIIPGLTSAIGVLSAAGYPLTCRTLGRSFAVTSARKAGGDFNEVYPKVDSLVVMMCVGVLDRVVVCLAKNGWPTDTPAVVIEKGTLPHERHITGPLHKIAHLANKAQIESPAILAVGSVADKRL